MPIEVGTGGNPASHERKQQYDIAQRNHRLKVAGSVLTLNPDSDRSGDTAGNLAEHREGEMNET